MSRHEILETLELLAKANNAYNRLLNVWVKMKALGTILSELEEMNFENEVELVLYIDKTFLRGDIE